MKTIPPGAIKRSEALRMSYAQVVKQLEGEVCEYERLKSGTINIPRLNRLDHIASFIAKIRIAKGVSQSELARRLRLSKQVVSRFEQSDYQTAKQPVFLTLQRIVDALSMRTAIGLTSGGEDEAG